MKIRKMQPKEINTIKTNRLWAENRASCERGNAKHKIYHTVSTVFAPCQFQVMTDQRSVELNYDFILFFSLSLVAVRINLVFCLSFLIPALTCSLYIKRIFSRYAPIDLSFSLLQMSIKYGIVLFFALSKLSAYDDWAEKSSKVKDKQQQYQQTEKELKRLSTSFISSAWNH